MNTITLIVPYKQFGMWRFDDANVGLKGEPFIDGADIILDHLTERIPDAANGFRLLFSATPFPGYHMKLEWVREDGAVSGNWYRWAGTDLEGWLCPALFKYFDEAPANIFVKAEALKI